MNNFSHIWHISNFSLRSALSVCLIQFVYGAREKIQTIPKCVKSLWESGGKIGVVVDKFVWLVGLVGESGGFARVLSGLSLGFLGSFERYYSLLFRFLWGFECRTTANTTNLIERK